ncbi:Transmembrane protein 97 [Prunus dulcis]|uniref:Transmembrane protein 97 n=1 Tax=Prunus dulcis TaxID=3755 RepID=A0A4Y1R776_PRUDU|nr:Transmembrane protein 97 [Prunus dulcis]
MAPLIDAQTCLPQSLFPNVLVELKSWYARQYGDYLWPLSIANLYGSLAAKSWFNTTCLIYGVSVFTSMVTILSELVQSGKASDKLLYMYFPFLGLGVLAILRGLLPPSSTTSSGIGKRPTLASAERTSFDENINCNHISKDSLP